MLGVSMIIIIVIPTACNSNVAKVAESDIQETVSRIEFADTDPLTARITNYTTTTRVGRRTYLFRDNDDVNNANFINKVEDIISEVENFIDVPYFQLRVHHTTNPQDLRFSATEVSLNFNDLNTFGWLTHILSRGELPVWLSVGLEAYIKSDLGLFAPTQIDLTSLDYFGDIPFAPKNWGTTENYVAINIAYSLINHLLENDLLSDVIAQPSNASSHFYDHFGRHMNTSLSLDFFYMIGGYSIVTFDHLATYNFIFDCFTSTTTVQNIRAYVDYLSAATSFTIDLMANFRDFEAMPLSFNIWYDADSSFLSGRYMFNHNINIYMDWGMTAFLYTVAHEVSHSVVYSMIGIPNPIIPLSEGFANVTSILFNKSEYSQCYHLFSMLEINRLGIESIRELFELEWSYGVHFPAHRRLTRENYSVEGVGFGSRGKGIGFSEYMNPINTYITATSFVIWLIDGYGLDSFMEVFWNVGNFYGVYGRDVGGMIEQWRGFLDELVVVNN